MKAENKTAYIHGTEASEQARLALLNRLTNAPFIEFLELRAGASVLEVGSGLGILAREVSERVPEGRVCGVEYASAQLALARNSTGNLHFVQADAHALPFIDERFDAVYCRYLLEHVADPLQVLTEMRRVLRPGGRALAQENNILIITFYPECPAFEAVWQRFAALQSRLGGDALIGKKLFSLFKKAGFSEIKLSIQPEIHYAGTESFRPWVENLIGNVEGGAGELERQGLATAREIKETIAEMRAFAERDDACTIFYWNRASGVKS
ncbi:MAG TPA: methyltransferase domain-containing protein [Pyrinomonadaceae bacterium]